MLVDTDQLLSHEEIAKIKGLPSNLLAYYLKKPGSPRPILVLGKKGYLRAEIEAWHITPETRGRKPHNKEDKR